MKDCSGDDVEFEQQLLGAYQSTCQSHITALPELDAKQVQFAAHAIKGSSSQIGATKVAAAAAALEDAVKSGKGGPPAMRSAVVAAYVEFLATFKSYLATARKA